MFVNISVKSWISVFIIFNKPSLYPFHSESDKGGAFTKLHLYIKLICIHNTKHFNTKLS